ncbi:P-loop containing nucleoside triphosphate hydrolase protein [Trichoderma sp. SZMC 28015]
MQCPTGSDDSFGPRVNVACRPFDFTLLFEDAFFMALPAAVMVLVLPLQFRKLWRMPIVTASYRLAAYKSAALVILIIFHLVALALRVQSSILHTRMAIATEVLSVSSNVGALALSFLVDQRSVKPSDVLVLYYSASTILGIPRLRTLWLFPSDYLIQQVIWTGLLILTASVATIECFGKTKYLRPAFKNGLTSEQMTSFWSRSFFVWLLPVFQKGYSNLFLVDDLPDIDKDMKESATWAELEAAWRRTQGGRIGFRLVRATFRANSWSFFSAIVPRLMLSAFTFCQPFLIQAAVSHLSGTANEDDHERFGQALVGAFALVYLGIAISRAVYWRQTYRMLAKVRAGLTAKIYRQTVSLQSRDVEDSAALTLMGTDVERIVESLRFFHETWAAIPEVAIGVWLLTRQVLYASIAPLVICVISLAGTSLVAKHFGPAQKRWVDCVEKRIGATSSMLSNIKSAKMLGLMNHWSQAIEKLRAIEIDVSGNFRILRVWAIIIGNVPGSLAPFVTLAIYALIALTSGDQSLLVTQAFTSLALINLVTEPLLMFCQALPSLTQAVCCFSRIEKFLIVNSSSWHLESHSPLEEDTSSMSLRFRAGHSSSPHLITFQSANISWLPKNYQGKIVLHNLNFSISTGFTAIVGPVGSGKTSLLASILGETTVVSGEMQSHITSRVAFCSQRPWLTNDTIKNNVIGELEFDQTWFSYVIQCCALREDLENLPGGIMTVVGENGSSLSGGQRQRVALARAVYSKLPTVILDDFISGLDPKAAKTIQTSLFHTNGHFRKAGISVILAANGSSLLPYMDSVVLLEEGSISDTGSYEHIKARKPDMFRWGEHTTDSNYDQAKEESSAGHEMEPQGSNSTASQPQGQIGGSDRDEFSRQKGSWSVYSYYSKKAGKLSLFLWAISTLIGAISNSYSTLWVDRWTSASAEQGNQQLGLYLGIYFLLVALAIIGVFFECWTFFLYIVRDTAIKLHTDLLHAVISAPFYFFLESDLGSITNRFSQDMNLIDMTLPSQALQFTSGFSSCLVQFVVLCVLGKYLAAVVPVLGGVLFLVQRYYLRTSRQLRMLEIEAKTPLYSHFTDTISGIATIRAFGWQIPFSDRLAAILNRSQRPFYMLFCVQQWLTLVVDLVAGALAVTLVAIALSLTANSLGPGALGVALVMTLQFNGLLIQTIQSWTKLETSIGAVARVQQFVNEAPSDLGRLPAPSNSWPQNGRVQVQRLTAAHTPRSEDVLKDVSLDIAAGEKIAVCGSSGSGKTSLIMAMMQMMDVRSGRVVIDDIDVATLDGESLRSHLNVVPQEPFFMPGTLRFNLDPRGVASDASIEAMLRRVSARLWDKLATGSNGGLHEEFKSSQWSHGEQQLLCLTRALLIPSKVIVFDEAMSSVDEKTEALMQDIVEAEFKDRTVISIIHRYSHIDWFDRIAVLREGRIVECDSAHALLSKPGSAFRALYIAAGKNF